MNAVLEKCIQSLIPSLCLYCGRDVSDNSLPLCRGCLSQLANRTTSQLCKIHPPMDIIFACSEYKGIIKKCLKDFKFRNNKSLTSIFQIYINKNFDTLNCLLEHVDHIIPVPISRERLLQRGFNQSEVIAELLGGIFHKNVINNFITKTYNTMSKSYLNAEERFLPCDKTLKTANNVSIQNKNILLVDDILTTGTTLKTTARELKKKGAGKIYGFVMAKTTYT